MDPGERGGAEKYFLSLIEGLEKERFEALLVIPKKSFDLLGLGGRLLGCRVNVISSRSNYFKLRRVFKAEQPDITHFNMPTAFSCFAAIAAARALKKSVKMATVHSVVKVQSRFLLGRHLKYLISKMLFNMLDIIITVSRKSAIELEKNFGIPKKKIRTVHNGIDLVAASKSGNSLGREALGIPEGIRFIGVPARIVKGKGHEVVLEAFASVKDRYPDVKVLIIGGGPLHKKISSLVRSLDIEDKIMFTGHVDDAVPYINACDIIAVPSRHEAFPYAVLEAMALAKPVIASKVGGIPEMIDDKVTGILVDKDDPDAWAGSMERLLQEDRQAKDISAKAAVAASRFDIKSMICGTERIYDENSC